MLDLYLNHFCLPRARMILLGNWVLPVRLVSPFDWELVPNSVCLSLWGASSYLFSEIHVKSWNQIIQIISQCYWCFFNHLSLLGCQTVAEVAVVMCYFPSWIVPFSSFLLLGYNFVLSACDKSMKWQHALEIFTTLKSKRLEATLYLGFQTWAFRGPWRQNHLWETTSWAILQLASTSWRGMVRWYVFLHVFSRSLVW